MLSHIALVSQSASITTEMLAPVAAAIQKQVLRDFGPLWNVTATVDVLDSLDQLPVDYWPIVIRDDIGSANAGFHRRGDTGQPFALIRPSANWTLVASHECLEMLADPWGNRVVAGASPKGSQGRVAFLVEVCDPCQGPGAAYLVNGVPVSDFCTPHYFDPVKSPSVRYSFTGKVTAPREVLDGGYLTWQMPDTQHLWQLRINGAKRRFVDIGVLPPTLASLRECSDRSAAKRKHRASKGPGFHPSRLVVSTSKTEKPMKRSAGGPTFDRRLSDASRRLQLQIDRVCAPKD